MQEHISILLKLNNNHLLVNFVHVAMFSKWTSQPDVRSFLYFD